MDRRVRRDLALATGAQLFYKLVGYLLLALLARHLAKDLFGAFLFAGSLAGLAVLATDLGTRDHLTREAAARPAAAWGRLGEALSLRLPLLALYLAALAGFGLLLKRDILLVILLSALYVGLRDLYRSLGGVLLGLRRVATHVFLFGSAELLLLVLVVLVVTGGGGLWAVLAAYVAAAACLMGASVAYLRLRVGRVPLAWDTGRARRLVRASFPFFALTVLALVHLKVDTLMLGFLRPYAVVAEYEASAKLLEASQLVVRPMTAIFFPVCVSLATGGEWERLRRMTRRLLAAGAGAGILVTLAVVPAAGLLVPLVYGAAYAEAAPLLRVLYLSVPGLYVTLVGTFVANALHLERRAALIMLAGVILNVGSNAALIPAFGAMGAAVSTLVSQTAVGAWLAWLALRGLARSPSPLSPAASAPAVRTSRPAAGSGARG